MKEDISFVAKGIHALPKDLQTEAIEMMEKYNNYIQSVAKTFTEAVGEACKDLMTIAGVNTDLVNKDTIQTMKADFEKKGFRLITNTFEHAAVLTFSQSALFYKGEFVAAVLVWLDPTTDTITNRMYDSQRKAYNDLKKLSKGEFPNG